MFFHNHALPQAFVVRFTDRQMPFTHRLVRMGHVVNVFAGMVVCRYTGKGTFCRLALLMVQPHVRISVPYILGGPSYDDCHIPATMPSVRSVGQLFRFVYDFVPNRALPVHPTLQT